MAVRFASTDFCSLPILACEAPIENERQQEGHHEISNGQRLRLASFPIRLPQVAEQPAQQQQAEHCEAQGQRAVSSEKSADMSCASSSAGKRATCTRTFLMHQAGIRTDKTSI